MPGPDDAQGGPAVGVESVPSPAVRFVVVLGGGVLGVSTAVHLQRAGLRTALLTRGALADGASGRSLSWVNSAGTFSDAYHRLRTVAVDRYRTLSAQDPGRDWLRFDGGVWWPERDEETPQRHAAQVDVGYDSHLLTPDEVWAGFRGSPPRAPR